MSPNMEHAFLSSLPGVNGILPVLYGQPSRGFSGYKSINVETVLFGSLWGLKNPRATVMLVMQLCSDSGGSQAYKLDPQDLALC